ncbi:FtsH protease activity modulator HflK [Vannielia litorea]|uniref:FtsH protease activity modulator HflK n=1 Tax=Vannielia TaxID=2813041 RepID=UPI001C97F489|nr:FtsH protease activity modulator HflK [Vannielia litorea]MBY6046445.1 FtsH protease activity modulator HflK [Vannielia litorea]MBY6073858.1 FtsH protease activity modulator HflK [Vannielia litorea]MBY6153646.1 FtsH protease activity modulator HflK [Vannielia litorea]
MAGNNGGPWGGGSSGGGGGNGDDGDRSNRPGGGGRRPGEGSGIPEIDQIMKKGQEQLKVLMGGRGGNGRGTGGGGRGGGGAPWLTGGTLLIGAGAAALLWAFASFYTVRPEQQSVELFLGEFSDIGTEGLNFAPWPLVTAEVIDVTTNRTEDIGVRRGQSGNDGLMLTTDENIVDIDFQVVWNVKNAADFLFALEAPEITVRSVAESAMREVIAQSELAPILNRDRASIEARVDELIQQILDQQQTGINVVRVNFNKVDPPAQQVAVTDINGETKTTSVIDAFRDVQAAEQERDQVQRQADAYANGRLAQARGQGARILEQAEAYRSEQVNQATGESSRFLSVLEEYRAAPEVTRKRLYLETMEKVLGDIDKIILENQGGEGGQGVVPYLPLNELRRSGSTGGSN